MSDTEPQTLSQPARLLLAELGDGSRARNIRTTTSGAYTSPPFGADRGHERVTTALREASHG